MLLDDINSYTGQFIEWADDDYFPCILYVKIKNYVLVETDGTVTIKGSALKASMKEAAFKQFIQDIIKALLMDRQDMVSSIYFHYAGQILNLKDITDWCSKKTITKAVLTNTRTNEKRIRDALKGRPVQEGDKVFTFFKTPTEICLLEDFDGTYCVNTLLGKLYDTLCIFETVIDVKTIPNLTLKRNQPILTGLKDANT
jgi:hypothetical protein